MSALPSMPSGTLEEMRGRLLRRFVGLFENQTRTHHFAVSVSALTRQILTDLAADIEQTAGQMESPDMSQSGAQAIAANLRQRVARIGRLDSTLRLLLAERERQWRGNDGALKCILGDFNRTVEQLAGTLFEKDLLERQGRVLESIILSHGKVSQWKDFVQEILSGFRSVFPFNLFFIAFAEKKGHALHVYHVGERSSQAKVSASTKLAREMVVRLGLAPDTPLDIEEFHVPHFGQREDIEEMRLITMPVPKLDVFETAGLLGVAYGSVHQLTPQEEDIIRSILAVMVMVTGSSKALSRTLAELEYYSTHDPLTGLHNRRYFNEILDYEIGRSERHGHEFSLLLLDLDDFKDVNDTYGHALGDAVLQRVAETMRGVVRKGDLAMRIGGDEFVILLTETGHEGAMVVAEKLRTELRAISFEGAPGTHFHITTSIGVVTYPGEAKTVSDLMTGVDLGLYRAKDLGKDGVGTLDAASECIQTSRMSRDYAEKLRAALKEGRIVPHFQPIFECRSRTLFAYETLARLMEPTGETIAASAFIETIEKYRLGRELDQAIVTQALGVARSRIEERNSSPRLFINLSAQEIQGQGSLGFAERLCVELDVPPQTLVFEILERDAIVDMTHMRKFLSEFRSKGFLFALDDFGSGYNSFHYLRELHFDFVKIDGAFVKNILGSKIDRALVRNLCRLCKDLGMLTIAEFVESAQVLEALCDMGIDYAQGYHLGVPAPGFAYCQ